MQKRTMSALLLAGALAICGCGAGSGDDSKQQNTTAHVEATSDTILAAMPPDVQASVREVVARLKEEITLETGTPSAGEPDDISCKEWIGAPDGTLEDFAGIVLRGSVPGSRGAAPDAGTFVGRINEACVENREASATGWVAREVALATGRADVLPPG